MEWAAQEIHNGSVGCKDIGWTSAPALPNWIHTLPTWTWDDWGCKSDSWSLPEPVAFH